MLFGVVADGRIADRVGGPIGPRRQDHFVGFISYKVDNNLLALLVVGIGLLAMELLQSSQAHPWHWHATPPLMNILGDGGQVKLKHFNNNSFTRYVSQGLHAMWNIDDRRQSSDTIGRRTKLQPNEINPIFVVYISV
jgi:hypothetical protein